MRNQLAHDISIDSDFCKQSDIEWVKNFYESILRGIDPLTRVYKAKQASQQKGVAQQRLINERVAKPVNKVEEKTRKSLWSRIMSKIKNWFS